MIDHSSQPGLRTIGMPQVSLHTASHQPSAARVPTVKADWVFVGDHRPSELATNE